MSSNKSDSEWRSEIARTINAVESDPSPSLRSYTSPVLTAKALAQCMDHTLLKTDATSAQVDVLCDEAREYGFKTVCVRLNHVAQAVQNLKDTDVGVCCVVGFHEGTQSLDSKPSEAHAAIAAGATELDMVLNYPLLLDGAYSRVYDELHSLRQLSAPSDDDDDDDDDDAGHVTLKLILETSQLAPDAIVAATHLAWRADLDFVKTSTGFNGRGATLEDVFLMRRTAEYLAREKAGGRGREMLVKASGGVRSLADARGFLAAGAARLGTSGSVGILREMVEGGGGGAIRDDDCGASGY